MFGLNVKDPPHREWFTPRRWMVCAMDGTETTTTNEPVIETAPAAQEAAEEAQALAKVQAYLDEQSGKAESPKPKEGEAGTGKTKDGEEDTAGKTGASETPPKEKSFTPSERQRQAAKHLGYEDEDVTDFTEREWKLLERHSAQVRKMESRIGRIQQELKTASKTPKEGDETPAGDGEGEAVESGDGEASGEAAPPKSFKLETITQDDDGTAATHKINTMIEAAGAILERLQKVEQLHAESSTAEADRADREARVEADKFFKALDPEIWGQFGEGSLADMDGRSAEAKARKALLADAARIMDMREDEGEECNIADALDAALRLRHKDKYIEAAAKSRRKADEARQSRSAARGTATAPHVKPKSDDEEEAEGRRKLAEFAATRGVVMTP